MSSETSISETMQLILQSALATVADADMHAQMRLHRNGLVIIVNSGSHLVEQFVRWEDIEAAFDLEALISGETLVAIENIKRSAKPR